MKSIELKNYTSNIPVPSPTIESSKMPPLSKNIRVRRESTNQNLSTMASARLGGIVTPGGGGRSASTKPLLNPNEGYMQATKSWAKKNVEKIK